MNPSNPLTVFVRIEALSISKIVVESLEPFLLTNNLNPVMIPCLKSSGGSCQDAEILVEVIAVTAKPLGGSVGAEIKRNQLRQNIATKRIP